MYLLKFVAVLSTAWLLPLVILAQAQFRFSNQGEPVSIMDPATGSCIKPLGEPWHLQLMAAPVNNPPDQMQPLTPLMNFVEPNQPGCVSNQVFVIPGHFPGELENIWIRVLMGSDPATAQVMAVAGPFSVLPQIDASHAALVPGLGSLNFCNHVVFVDAYLQAEPETLAINEGEVVTWQARYAPLTVESYSGEWKSPVLAEGQRYFRKFSKPGTYVYLISIGAPPWQYSPGLIRVRKVSGDYPAISIVEPLDNMLLPYVHITATITNPPLSTAQVQFYADGQLIGASTYPPYNTAAQLTPGKHVIMASVVDLAGQTNTSSPVRVTIAGEQVFQPWRMPQGQTVILKCASGGPYCVLSSEDFTGWRGIPGRFLQGRQVVIDETTTNVMQRFYKLVDCL